MMIPTVRPADLPAALAAAPNATLIDVRTPAEFEEVHVIGATNQPLDRLDPACFTAGEPIYVLCRTGARARLASEKLATAGIDSATVVEEGTLGCVEAGLPVRRGKKAISLERQVRIAAGSLVVTGVALSLVHPAWLGLAAFVGAGLVYAGVTDTCGMGMLLAKAPWNRAPRGGDAADTHANPRSRPTQDAAEPSS